MQPTHVVVVAALAASVFAARAADAEEPPPAPAAPAAAAATAADPAIAELRGQLEEQRRAQEALAARVAAQEKALAEEKAARSAPPPVELRGYLHVDWSVFRQSSQNEVTPNGEPINEDRFVLKRARIGAVTDRGLLYGTVVVDANTNKGPQVRPWNAEIALKWPEKTAYATPAVVANKTSDGPFFIVSAGLVMTPFGFEVPELESVRPFLERATFANALFPQSYDLGVRVLGGYKALNWALGIMNGDPIGEKTFPGRDPNKSKDLVFRIGAAADVGAHARLSAGFSGLSGRGFHAGDQQTKDQLVWRDENEDGVVQQTEIRDIPGSPGTPSETFQRFALGADARAEVDLPVLGTLAFRAEIVRAKNLDRGLVVADPVASSRDLRELGWSVAVTQDITKWVIVGVRRDAYDPDADAQEQQPFAIVPRDQTFATWGFMAALRYKKARLLAQYDLRTNALGRDPGGQPITLADDSFTLRAALSF